MRNLWINKEKSIALVAMGLLVLSIGCGAEDQEDNEERGDSAQVHGQLEAEGEGEGEFEGQTVSAYEMDDESEMKEVSKEDATVESDGSFTVLVDLNIYSGGDLFLESKDGESSSGSVLVEASVESNSEVDTAPINSETTFETDVYVHARSSGEWNENSTTAHQRAMIGARAAAAAYASADYQSEVEAMAKATTSAMRASAEFLMETEGKTRAELESSFEARSTARAEADSQLLSGADSETTINAYLEASAQARSDMEMDSESQAREAHAWAEAYSVAAAQFSAEVGENARAEMEAQRSFFVSAAVEAHMEALGDGEAGQNAAVDCGSVVIRGVDEFGRCRSASIGLGQL